MNKNLKSRKNYYKKGTGFSKYDKNGNVIYSESIGNLGETVRHFYFYDDLNRRIRYRREEMLNTFEEVTEYFNDGSKQITTSNSNSSGWCTRMYNNMGRMIDEQTVDDCGNMIHTIYKHDTYVTFKSKIPYEYIL